MCGLFSIDYSYPNNIKKADPEGLGRKTFKIWTSMNKAYKMKNLTCTNIHRSILIIHYYWCFKISFLIHFFTGCKAVVFDISLVTLLHSIYAGIWVRVLLQGSSALS
jgi:hypothetical protein